MEKVDVLIIGAGAVGLAIAQELSLKKQEAVVVEQEETFGRHTSSRNSEVIHSGIYYPMDSLKATLCVEGNKLLYRFCQTNDIPYRKTGKLVIANDIKEQKYLDRLLQNGRKNGVQGLQLLNKQEICRIEPEIIAEKALLVESTGIFDTHSFMKKMENEIQTNGGFIIYGMRVMKIDRKDNSYIVSFANGERWQANWLINSAGLFCDTITTMLGINNQRENLTIHYCKGEYYKLKAAASIEHLIYPVPDANGIFLGIHLTLNLHNEIRFGPNAYYVDDISYRFDEQYKDEFLQAINQYFSLKADDIHPDDCGIRPKLQGNRESFRDFYISEESKRGLPRFMNLMGIESPGLTASLAIAKYVVKGMEKCD